MVEIVTVNNTFNSIDDAASNSKKTSRQYTNIKNWMDMFDIPDEPYIR